MPAATLAHDELTATPKAFTDPSVALVRGARMSSDPRTRIASVAEVRCCPPAVDRHEVATGPGRDGVLDGLPGP